MPIQRSHARATTPTEEVPQRRSIGRAALYIKKSAVERAEEPARTGTSRVRQLLEEEDTSVQDLRASDEEHEASLDIVRATLQARGITYVEHAELPKQRITDVDLVIAVGGDGMVLGVSHNILDDIPVLGVNSAPSFSVGYLSGCTATGLDATLNELADGELAPLSVQRLQIELGHRRINEPVLNDLLFCADNPAAMSRYLLIWPDGSEVQRSSGVWISTPAGSTSALTSAGGPILPLVARQFAFLVREPYAPPGASVRFRSAVLSEHQSLKIECRTFDASVFVDGTHQRHPVAFGDCLEVSLHPQPLCLVRRIH